MVWEGSVLDANEGIRFHGKTIKDCQEVLPKGTSGTEMLPEAMFWLLLTGEVPLSRRPVSCRASWLRRPKSPSSSQRCWTTSPRIYTP